MPSTPPAAPGAGSCRGAAWDGNAGPAAPAGSVMSCNALGDNMPPAAPPLPLRASPCCRVGSDAKLTPCTACRTPPRPPPPCPAGGPSRAPAAAHSSRYAPATPPNRHAQSARPPPGTPPRCHSPRPPREHAPRRITKPTTTCWASLRSLNSSHFGSNRAPVGIGGAGGSSGRARGGGAAMKATPGSSSGAPGVA